MRGKITKVFCLCIFIKVRELCSQFEESCALDVTITESMSLKKFIRKEMNTLKKSQHNLREKWIQATVRMVRDELSQSSTDEYRLDVKSQEEYDSMPLKRLLKRIGLMTEDSLRFCTEKTLRDYTAFLSKYAQGEYIVRSMSEVTGIFTEKLAAAVRQARADNAGEQPAMEILNGIMGDPALAHELAPNALKAFSRPQSLFLIDVVVSEKESVINRKAVDEYKAARQEWDDEQAKKAAAEKEGNAGKKKKQEKEECPVVKVDAIWGHTFEFEIEPEKYMQEVLYTFDHTVQSLQTLPTVEPLVADRLFWNDSNTSMTVPAVSEDEEWVKGLRSEIETAVKHSMEPLDHFLDFFEDYQSFLNLDVEQYFEQVTKECQKMDDDDDPSGKAKIAYPMHALIHVHISFSAFCDTVQIDGNGDDSDDEPYVEIDLEKLGSILTKHSKARDEVHVTVPSDPVNVGLFAIDCNKARHLLYKKHTDILLMLLKHHVEHCRRFSVAINKSFMDIFKLLGVSPHNIEELTELQELIDNVDKKLDPAAEQIQFLLENFSILEDFNCPIPYDVFDHKWRVIGWPKKIMDQVEKTKILIEDRKAKFLKTMKEEQSTFALTLDILAEEIDTLSKYNSIKQVDEVAEHCQSLDKRIQEATDNAALMCSREILFNAEVTDYSQLSVIKKTYEPYKQLWSTSANWLKTHDEWSNGSFLNLEGEKVEQIVEASGVAINKAFRFFKNAEMTACTTICQSIKDQITNFKPHVPLIQSLRNPGMRERHWNALGDELGIPNFNPDESFTLQKCIALKFNEHVESVQKVGDMAAKEYQIEKALNEMEALWEPMDLNIISYRNTGTGVLKAVDEIQAVLDEQVTMTQAMQFSSFKGPFEERISTWDSKLFIFSEVLDEWMAVQRSWLYLQPIFESPDINKQLPVEGKRFATVDKNWRQTMSSAKSKPKAIDFCSNEKLLQKFQESNKFLDMVQKGLSEYLETKRGAFARFYFLSNDELLSILSETKDVKLVQPHLKKCFEGVNAVNFEDDLKISAMISQVLFSSTSFRQLMCPPHTHFSLSIPNFAHQFDL
jgi:dynein heavy chain